MVNGDNEGALTFFSESVIGASVVDLFLYSPASANIIEEFKVLNMHHSDHLPVSVSLSCYEVQIKPVVMSKMKIRIPKDNHKFQTLNATVNSKLRRSDPIHNLDLSNEQLIKAVHSACLEHKLVQNPKPIKPNLKPKWFDNECCEMKKEVNYVLRKLRRSECQEEREGLVCEFRRTKDKYTRLRREKADSYNVEQQQKLHNIKDSSTFWKTVQSLQFQVRTYNTIEKNIWYDHFLGVFSTVGPYRTEPIVIPENYVPDEILDKEFTISEIQEVARHLKPNKAAGIDMVPNEIWKNGSAALLIQLCSIFQLCFASGRVPAAWGECVISPLYKKGSKSLPSNYRPISLLNTILKLYTGILNVRLNHWIKKHSKISEFQAGFQKNKSTLDHIFVLNSLVQTQLLQKKKLFACFIDLSQAFDSPDHDKLWKVLLNSKVSPKWVRSMACIYELAVAKVITCEGLTDPIKIMKGVLQGESASPSIFNLFLEGLVSALSMANVAGFRLGSTLLHILLYADDMVILAPSAETLQIKLKIAAKFLKERGLQVNLEKTKVVVFRRAGRLKQHEAFNWNDSRIEIVKSYTYLGVKFSSSGLFNVAASEFALKGVSAQGALLSVIKRTKNFSLAAANKLFSSIIQSTTLYAGGIWSLSVGDILEPVQQKYYKQILNLPRCTPEYFVRLETGKCHLSHVSLSLALSTLIRILSSPPNSLLFESFNVLRRVSLFFPDPKYSWYLQLRLILSSIKEEKVLDNLSANFLYISRERVLQKHRWSLAEQDLDLARHSSTIPHYSQLVTRIQEEAYLNLSIPLYLITTILQLRLNYSLIFNQGSWHNLGMFEDLTCKFCGERDSFSHLFACHHYQHLKTKFVSTDPVVELSSAASSTLNSDIKYCKIIYVFISSALRLRSI